MHHHRDGQAEDRRKGARNQPRGDVRQIGGADVLAGYGLERQQGFSRGLGQNDFTKADQDHRQGEQAVGSGPQDRSEDREQGEPQALLRQLLEGDPCGRRNRPPPSPARSR